MTTELRNETAITEDDEMVIGGGVGWPVVSVVCAP